MSLPWDELQPEVEEPPPPAPIPVPAPEVTYGETENLPEKVGAIDFGKILKDAFSEALREAGPRLKEGAKDYAREAVTGVLRGETVDVMHPTITAETSKGHELIVADAKSRSWRTLIQGLAVDVIFAILAVLAMLTDMDPLVKETWILIGVLLVKSVLSAIVSYFMRLRVTPTIRTPGEKMAIMPVPRPMIDEEWKERSA